MPPKLLPENLTQLIATTRAAKTIWLPLEKLPHSVNRELQTQLATMHRLNGASVANQKLAVFGFLIPPESRFILDLEEEELKFFPYGWCLEFGSAMTVTATPYPPRESPGLIPRVFLFRDSPVLPHMVSGKFQCVFYNGSTPVRYCEVEIGERLKIEVEKVLNHKAHLYSSNDVLFWEILNGLKSLAGLRHYLQPDEQLSLGWQMDYLHTVQFYSRARDEIMAHCDYSAYKDAGLPASIVEFFDTCLPSGFECGLVAKFAESIFNSLDRFVEFARAFDAICAFSGTPPNHYPQITSLAIQLAIRSPATTACGRRVLWVQGNIGNGMGLFEPDAANFPKSFNPEEYWKRIPYNLPHWALGSLVRQSDVPVGLPPDPVIWHSFPKTEQKNRLESITVANNLIDEALSNKKWVIPHHALVQTPAGPFTHFEVSEFGDEIFFVGRTERGEFAILTFEIKNKALSFPELNLLEGTDEVLYDSIYAALKLLLAAVIRDFWVVENRESVFASKSSKRLAGVRVRTTDDGSPRVVYLPRIHYKDAPSPQNCSEALDHKTRAAHYVHQHIRKVERCSDAQIILAKHYGCQVPEGYTFVRPHERGKQAARAVIYRSRSALQSLYRIDKTLPAGTADWFRFEKDVERLLTKLGFDVQHRAASRNGDQGVDLYATKGADLELVNWIIQCKCYHLRHPIGPDKLRELHGAVMTYPPGTRGMIVTTSSFTSGSRALALELNLRLMDGAEFARLSK